MTSALEVFEKRRNLSLVVIFTCLLINFNGFQDYNSGYYYNLKTQNVLKSP